MRLCCSIILSRRVLVKDAYISSYECRRRLSSFSGDKAHGSSECPSLTPLHIVTNVASISVNKLNLVKTHAFLRPISPGQLAVKWYSLKSMVPFPCENTNFPDIERRYSSDSSLSVQIPVCEICFHLGHGRWIRPIWVRKS